jgi:hypothetical protein
MYNFQPKALTDRELIQYCWVRLSDEPLPKDFQSEILFRFDQRCEELTDALAQIQKLNDALQSN